MAQSPAFTVLQAINKLLRGVTQLQLASYPSASPSADETSAAAALNEALIEAQTKEEFSWATQGDVAYYPSVKQFTANGSGHISMEPSGTLLYFVMQATLHPQDQDYGQKIVDIRDDSGTRKLFNVTDGTFNWGAAAVKTLQITYSLDFTLLPPPAQIYVMALAKRKFLEDRRAQPDKITAAAAEEVKEMDNLTKWDMTQRPLSLMNAADFQGIRGQYAREPSWL